MNLIDVDNFISMFLRKNIDMYNYSKNRKNILSSIDYTKLGGRIYNDVKKDLAIIDELQFSELIFFVYKKRTASLIKKFLSILQTPIRKKEKDKCKILNNYLNVVKTCIPYNIFVKLNITDKTCNKLNLNYSRNFCQNCENDEKFLLENDILICKVCFSEVIQMNYFNNRSYNVAVPKYKYDRVSHFKKCIQKYQGKQYTFINPAIYSDLERLLIFHGIIKDERESRSKKFANVKKSHIIHFLKELGYTKHYDDYVLIHANLTGQKLNDISHLENILVKDFEKFSEKYSSIFTERKNFINTKFILYRLLLRHNHKLDEGDFLTVKSLDRKNETDRICKAIFDSLGWEYKTK